MTDESLHAATLLARAAMGDAVAWGNLLSFHQERLTRITEFRMDRRLRGRLDAADVVQDALIAATVRQSEFFRQSSQPLFLWLRWMVGNTLLESHRHHLGVQMRDVTREAHPGWAADGADREGGTRAALVEQLTGGATGPVTAARRAEVQSRLNDALGKLDTTDQEVLALRHYEQLTSTEAAQVLGIQERAAAKRYTRALERLREILAEMPGGLSELRI